MSPYQKDNFMNCPGKYLEQIFPNVVLTLMLTWIYLLMSYPHLAFANIDRDQLFIEVKQVHIAIKPQTNDTSLILQSSIKNSYGGSVIETFEVKKISAYIYHFRNKGWKDKFWKIDTEKKRVYRVSGGTFGSQSGTEVLIKNISIYENYLPSFGGQIVPELQIDIWVAQSLLTYTASTNSLRLAVEGDEIAGPNEWEIHLAEPGIYHMRLKALSDFPFFWRIDTASLKVSGVTNGHYDYVHSGTESGLLWEVRTTNFEAIKNESKMIEDDLDIKLATGEKPKSEWYESEKAIYRKVLQRNKYDVLVVPFQVQGHATDRIDRSLMTRYLVRKIESSTNSKVPNPTLAAKALGEVARRFDEEDVVQLAHALKVKTLIRGYIGHDFNKKAKLTIVVQTVDDRSGLAHLSKEAIFNWENIPFSDERLPSDTFTNMLDDIMAKLPLKIVKTSAVEKYDKVKKIPVPDSIVAMTSKAPASPILSAYYLQLLGSLYPEPSVAREYLFERSLVALLEVSAKSPDYPLLKARAYFYLHRRPAASAVMNAPSTPEEKAFKAILDGNFPEAREYTDKIDASLAKLMAQIELDDLRWQYEDRPSKKEINDIIRDYPNWKAIVLRRIDSNDRWQVQSNYIVKSLLDEMFPIVNYSAKDIVKKNIVLGDFDDDEKEIDLSVYKHRIKLLEQQSQLFAHNESWRPVKRDILDLLDAIGESNLLNKLRLPTYVQVWPDRPLTLIDRYETIYRGHVDMTFIKSRALWLASYAKQGRERSDLAKRAEATQNDACYWSQGQLSNPYARQARPKCRPYDNDIPRRWFWNPSPSYSNPGDDYTTNKYIPVKVRHDAGKTYPLMLGQELNNLDTALQYTNSEFSILASYYDKLISYGWHEGANRLLQDYQDRFIGNPSRVVYLAKIKENKRDYAGAEKLYKDAIAEMPDAWQPYEKLGHLHITKGMFQEAFELYSHYPPFIKSRTADSTEDIDTVALSNHAYHAADDLFWHGDIEHATPLFQLSAGYQTGSGAGMISEIMLNQLGGNFAKAAQGYLELAKRYNQVKNYGGYAELLHTLGYHEEAWSVFENFDMIKDLWSMMRVPFVGLRMEGKNDAEQRQWLLQHDLKKISTYNAQHFILYTHLTDRAPDKNILHNLTDIEQKISVARKGDSTDAKLFAEDVKDANPSPNMKDRSWALWFADGYNNLRMKRFSDAYVIFSGTNEAVQSHNYRSSGHVLPYSAWSAVKSGHVAEIDSYLDTYKNNNGETFDYHLARAFIDGGKTNHKAALAHLEAAQFNITSDSDRPLFVWYQLVEASEWLYQDTNDARYRELALKFAKLCQILRPTYAWTYAVEAKYTASDKDRIRALAITLYLDRNSERISGFSRAEREEALTWLKNNNPFLKIRQNDNKSET